ncbi:MAG: Hpt domain-containing protein [Lachnospiraceae bacterium]|nr:Hpt domain-containing protein [Lachnospiraceae bacterium]
MTLREMYEGLGSNYDEVLERLMNNEGLITKLLKKYAEDQNFEKLKAAMAEKNYEDAFTAAHTLKGLAANLGFTELYERVSTLTEKLRGGEYEGNEELLSEVGVKQEAVVSGIGQLAD